MKTVTFDENLWQVVPKEPTDAMCGAAIADTCWENMNPPPYPCYKAMLSAAPSPPVVEGEPVGIFNIHNENSHIQVKPEYADEEYVKLYLHISYWVPYR